MTIQEALTKASEGGYKPEFKHHEPGIRAVVVRLHGFSIIRVDDFFLAARCAAMDIVSLRSPGCHTGSGDRLLERVTRRTGNGKAQQVPSPADVAGRSDHHGAIDGIAGD
jgi:hypothetical protein